MAGVERPKALVVSFSDLKRDPRVYRQIDLLATKYHVTTVGLAGSGIDGVTHVDVVRARRSPGQRALRLSQLLFGRYDAYARVAASVDPIARALSGQSFDVIVANEVTSLPVAAFIKGKARLLYDAHEYTPRQHEESLKWRLVTQRYVVYLLRRYLPAVDVMTTVCPGIAAEYERVFGVRAKVVLNAPPFQDLEPTETPDDAIRLVHLGAAGRARSLETMIGAVLSLGPRYTLDLYLVAVPGDEGYLRDLKTRYGGTRIRFPEPVPMSSIVHTIHAYDLGLIYFEPRTFNLRHVLPNKFFECVQARVGVVIGPSPEMAAYVERYGVGVVARSFDRDALARAIESAKPNDIRRMKASCHEAARELSYGTSAVTLLRLLGTAA